MVTGDQKLESITRKIVLNFVSLPSLRSALSLENRNLQPSKIRKIRGYGFGGCNHRIRDICVEFGARSETGHSLVTMHRNITRLQTQFEHCVS